MYNQIIRDRIENLTYLSSLKNSNASAITKKNPYGDIVKFYAQINKNDVIGAITFKATGCTYFVALSSYFCELAEGKTIDEALKINENDLVAFAKLDESKHHIYPLILSTFALLVKKYRKALADGKVKPCEVVKVAKKESKSVVKASTKKSTVTTNSDIMLSQKSVSKKSAVTEENIIASRVSSITREIRKTESELISLDSKRNEIQLSREEKKQLKLEEKARQKEEKKLAKEQKLADKKAKSSSNSLRGKATSTAPIVDDKKMVTKVSSESNRLGKTTSATSKSTKSATAGAKKSVTKVVTENESTTTKSTKTQILEVAIASSKKATGSKSVSVKSTSRATKSASSKATGVKGASKKIESAKDNIVVMEDSKKVASSKARTQKESTSSTIQIPKKSLDLAKINEDESIIISDEVPSENNTQIIVETIEQKRRVETVVTNGNTTTIEAGRVDAMKLSAEGDEAYKQIHSATSMGDMLHRLQTSQARVKDIEGHTAVNAKKTVNGKVVDSVSKSDSFSSMRDSLQKMRLEKESKALPSIENKDDNKDKPKKRGLFSKLFKK